MKLPSAIASIATCLMLIVSHANTSLAADCLLYFGSQANLGGTYYPGPGVPSPDPNVTDDIPYVTVPWRTSSAANIYATGDPSFPNQWYGKEGYALFATTFSYPNANVIPGDAFIDPNGDEDYVNMFDLPSWVSDSTTLAERMAGGWSYALIDDPVWMDNGLRYYSFTGTTYPVAAAGNNTGQNPWVKLGILDGFDIFGNHPASAPTGRWSFTVDPNTPSAFRLGVMTGGLDNGNYSPEEIFLQQFDPNGLPVGSPVSTGTLSTDPNSSAGPYKDRYVDMHFFDIVGAEEGDVFVIGVTSGKGSFGNAGISGFSFDVLPDIDADFNDDHVVDGEDFLILQRGFGVGTTHAEGDANQDNVVNNDDLKYWEACYGTVISAAVLATVPEPTTVVLFGMGGLALLGLRRRG